MSLKHRIGKLQQRQRQERTRVNKKYRALIRRVEAECEEHKFGEWHKRLDGLTGAYQSNVLGEPFYFRVCDTCEKTESMIVRDEQ